MKELRFIKLLPDGSVEAALIWETGYEILIVPSMEVFNKAKAERKMMSAEL